MDKLTRKEAKELTRQRLIEAVLGHVRDHGLSGLTTGKVADQAGIAQSSFYVHFTDMDEALRAAADKAGSEIRALVREARAQMDLSNPDAAYRAAYEGAIEALSNEHEFSELLLGHRRDKSSPLAEALRHVLEEARSDLAADLRRSPLAQRFETDIDLYAELMVGMTMTVLEGFLDGRIPDREQALRVMARMTRALIGSSPATKS